MPTSSHITTFVEVCVLPNDGMLPDKMTTRDLKTLFHDGNVSNV